jgi:hypothetical protein
MFLSFGLFWKSKELIEEDISHEEKRNVIDKIVNHTINFYAKGDEKEILTVDNHCDAVLFIPATWRKILREPR